MGYDRQKVVKQAESWLGCKESDGSHKPIIDLYNSHKPLARGYKMKYTDGWCSCFVSAVSIALGYTDIIPTEVSPDYHMKLFQKMGCWVENDAFVPQAGDIILYDWQDSGQGDNQGYPDHIGIVQKVVGSSIYVIEGNCSDMVKVRKLAVNGRYIRGFGVPKYDSNSQPTQTTPTEQSTSPTEAPTSPVKVDYAQSYDKSIAGAYKVTASVLNMRTGAGTNKPIIKGLKRGTVVQNYGYYTTNKNVKWLYVKVGNQTGFCSGQYLKKV